MKCRLINASTNKTQSYSYYEFVCLFDDKIKVFNSKIQVGEYIYFPN